MKMQYMGRLLWIGFMCKSGKGKTTGVHPLWLIASHFHVELGDSYQMISAQM